MHPNDGAKRVPADASDAEIERLTDEVAAANEEKRRNEPFDDASDAEIERLTDAVADQRRPAG
jgi:hypothetical protein